MLWTKLLGDRQVVKRTRYPEFLKRGVDISAAMMGLIVLGVPLLLAMLVVRVVDGSPVLFRQARIGRGGRPFMVLKLRTLTPARTVGESDAARLTPLGRALRRTSLDEVPQFINVLRGEMSLVGPRPLLPEYLPHYSVRQARRHEVRPGLTGWAQVCGRNALTWEERFELDIWYVDNRGLWLDLKILLRTVGIVILGKGIAQEGHASMEPFRGSHE